jgi:hypothetical protein
VLPVAPHYKSFKKDGGFLDKNAPKARHVAFLHPVFSILPERMSFE